MDVLRAMALGNCGGSSSNEDSCCDSVGEDDGNGSKGIGDNCPCCPHHCPLLRQNKLVHTCHMSILGWFMYSLIPKRRKWHGKILSFHITNPSPSSSLLKIGPQQSRELQLIVLLIILNSNVNLAHPNYSCSLNIRLINLNPWFSVLSGSCWRTKNRLNFFKVHFQSNPSFSSFSCSLSCCSNKFGQNTLGGKFGHVSSCPKLR